MDIRIQLYLFQGLQGVPLSQFQIRPQQFQPQQGGRGQELPLGVRPQTLWQGGIRYTIGQPPMQGQPSMQGQPRGDPQMQGQPSLQGQPSMQGQPQFQRAPPGVSPKNFQGQPPPQGQSPMQGKPQGGQHPIQGQPPGPRGQMQGTPQMQGQQFEQFKKPAVPPQQFQGRLCIL